MDNLNCFVLIFTQILSAEAENVLSDYLKKCNDMYFGLTTRQVRALAYDYAIKLEIDPPRAWKNTQMAGRDWMNGYLKRHNELSIRKPQATSMARASAFNRHNVAAFFAKLKKLYDKYHFMPQNVYNMDETGVTTVQVPDRVIARKGVKQVGRIVSAERGTLVTLAVAISAIGNMIPPFFIFPRKRFKNEFLIGGPPGCDGASNPSGWMNADQFYEFLVHFQKHAHASEQNPVLLILDNHESHLSIRGLDFCKDNGIVVLSLPPHCSHKLQPLDRAVFGPFKKYVNSECDSYCAHNPRDPMTIYHIPGIIAKTLSRAGCGDNVLSGFSCTGIYPFNENIFQDHEFMPAIDRPMPSTSTSACDEEEEGFLNESFASVAAFEDVENEDMSIANARSSTPIQTAEESNMSTGSNLSAEQLNATLESIRPFPQAAERKKSNRGRKKRHSEILTSSPVLAELRKEQEAKESRKAAVEAKKTAKAAKTLAKAAKTTAKKARGTAKVTQINKKSKAIAKPAKIQLRPKRMSMPARIGQRTTRASISQPSTSRQNDSDSEPDVNLKDLCCVCGDKVLRNSRYKLCIECRGKAHVDCVRTTDNVFTCPNCFSEIEIDTDTDEMD